MKQVVGLFLVAAAAGLAAERPGAQAPAAPQVAPPYVAPVVARLTGRTMRTFEVPEADQGVAADRRHFYAVDNTVVAKYDIESGALVTRWVGPANGLIRHMNSCLADGARIRCANSNYPATPMGSSIEVFDAATLAHVESHSLGLLDEGSLTWFDRFGDGWIAGFAHYDGNGGVAFKNHTFSSVVTFDAAWRRTGGWLLPATVLERMAPYAASGGAIGPDGWLYLSGHDRPELYAVARPAMGPTMIHLATVEVETEGQAFSWAQDGSRAIYTIDRRRHLVRRIDVPAVPPPAPTASARPFR